jgi:hypothetical protein
MEYVAEPPDVTTVVGYPYPSIITVMTVPLGAAAPFNVTVPWKRQGGPLTLSGTGGVPKGVAVVGATVVTGVAAAVGAAVGTAVASTVGAGVGVTYTVLVLPQPITPTTSTSTNNEINTTAIFFILPPSL